MVAVDAHVKARARQAVEALGRYAAVRAAYLFGSHVEGVADKWSDIDVAAFLDDLETWDAQHETRLIVQVQKEVGLDVEPHLFSTASLSQPEPGTLVRDIVRRGLRIL